MDLMLSDGLGYRVTLDMYMNGDRVISLKRPRDDKELSRPGDWRLADEWWSRIRWTVADRDYKDYCNAKGVMSKEGLTALANLILKLNKEAR
jgi:hypothetical protein